MVAGGGQSVAAGGLDRTQRPGKQQTSEQGFCRSLGKEEERRKWCVDFSEKTLGKSSWDHLKDPRMVSQKGFWDGFKDHRAVG